MNARYNFQIPDFYSGNGAGLGTMQENKKFSKWLFQALQSEASLQR